jgi:tellurite resistance protein TerC
MHPVPVHSPAVWIGFTAVIALLLVLDLGVLNRRAHVLTPREAAWWSGMLVVLAGLFAGFLWLNESSTSALEFVTGYVVELSLSVDNLFVFILLFQYFAVPPTSRAKVLKWGIFGAMVLRGVMIGFGALMLQQFDWIVYVFGAILVFTGFKMWRAGDDDMVDPSRNPVIRIARRLLPFTADYDRDRFVTRTAGGLMATPLLLVLLVVESTDLVFAIDSIPAIFAITRDPFIVYSSNIFAILGLRALFFLLASMMDTFRYLKPGVALILVFVGVKMLVSRWVDLPITLSLGVIVGILTLAVFLSLRQAKRDLSPPES